MADTTKNERILVVDDEESIRRITAAHLKRSGYEVILACNGREGLETAKETLPDLILLDLMMPEMDGYTVARNLRDDFATSQIPIIILTAKFTLDDKMAGLEVGANDYITKPFAVGELLARIRTVLNWSKQQRSANPLTGLPGNVSIEEALEERIQGGEPFAAVYVDLDNFKAYNDYYGYSQGDQAIKEIAGALVRSCRAKGDGTEFVGHIGGDDFIFFAPTDRAEAISRQVIEEFTNSLTKLIRPDDLRRGYIEVRGRTGDVKQFPILSVTLAMVTSERHQIEHVAQVGDIASEVKQYGKSIQGSVLVRDRRRENLPPVVAGGPEDCGEEAQPC